jgi:hypothetical protein
MVVVVVLGLGEVGVLVRGVLGRSALGVELVLLVVAALFLGVGVLLVLGLALAFAVTVVLLVLGVGVDPDVVLFLGVGPGVVFFLGVAVVLVLGVAAEVFFLDLLLSVWVLGTCSIGFNFTAPVYDLKPGQCISKYV